MADVLRGSSEVGGTKPKIYSREWVKEFFETPFEQRDSNWHAQRADIRLAVSEGRVAETLLEDETE